MVSHSSKCKTVMATVMATACFLRIMAFGHAVQTLLFFWFLTRVNPSPANQISTDDLSTKSMRYTFASFLISGWHWSIYTEQFLQQPGSQTKFLHKRVAYYSNSTATYNPVLLKLSLSMDVQPNPGPGIPQKNATLRCFLQNASSLKLCLKEKQETLLGDVSYEIFWSSFTEITWT